MDQPRRRDFRHTKIICTLGPASRELETLRALATAGMNIARLNMSHGDHSSHEDLITKIKQLNTELNHPIALLLDTQGPEIRTGDVQTGLELQVGEMVTLTVSPDDDPEEKSVHVNYKDLVNDLKVGDRITVDNGLINLEVLEARGQQLRCRVLDGGRVGSRRHVNLPGIRVNLPSITDKDRADIEFGLGHGVDFLALSFVRSRHDVLEARGIVERAGATTRVFAKIENQEGIDHFDEILEAADGIMVARGDLGVEVELRELPVYQRRMVRACVIAGKPVIVATHLLESMILNPMPTRAEVTDVANAVYEQADAIMLSGETGAGRHPVRCVQVLDDIARRIEKEPPLAFYNERLSASAREELARSACRLADSLDAPAIVLVTRSGKLAQAVAAYRPRAAIIYAFTPEVGVQRKLWMVRSVVPFVTELHSDPEQTVQQALQRLRDRNRLLGGDQVVIVSDIMASQDRVTTIQVRHFDPGDQVSLPSRPG
jgi:pyruvate kinase